MKSKLRDVKTGPRILIRSLAREGSKSASVRIWRGWKELEEKLSVLKALAADVRRKAETKGTESKAQYLTTAGKSVFVSCSWVTFLVCEVSVWCMCLILSLLQEVLLDAMFWTGWDERMWDVAGASWCNKQCGRHKDTVGRWRGPIPSSRAITMYNRIQNLKDRCLGSKYQNAISLLYRYGLDRRCFLNNCKKRSLRKDRVLTRSKVQDHRFSDSPAEGLEGTKRRTTGEAYPLVFYASCIKLTCTIMCPLLLTLLSKHPPWPI